MPLTTEDLTLAALRAAYAGGSLVPTELCRQLLPAIAAARAVFIARPTVEEVFERCRYLESLPAEQRGPLWGVPFAVKDNIDVEGLPTTAACPGFEYTPQRHARAVQPLVDAGGICVGKTNMDQFACGLVGTRTPYGIPANAFDDRFTPGGSSCGSAVAVAEALCTFALGTDTAGSGRVPAGNNGIVGIKPSVGRFSTTGVVPACYLLDCVSVFALGVADGAEVARLMENADVADPTYRLPNSRNLEKRYQPQSSFRFAVPGPEFLDNSFEGPGGEPVRQAMQAAWGEAVARLQALGGELVPGFDFAPFAETAVLLYGAAFVAERYAGIRGFLEQAQQGGTAALADISGDERMLKVIRSIISKTGNFSSADVFQGLQQLSVLRGKCRAELAKIDLLVVPTSAYNYTVEEILAEEEYPSYEKVTFPKNANLGRWTNFVNLQDMCGVSVVSGLLRPQAAGAAANGGSGSGAAAAEQQRRAEHLAATGNASPVLPFGITLLAPSWTDEYVAGIAAAYEASTGLKAGPLGHGVKPYRSSAAAPQQ